MITAELQGKLGNMMFQIAAIEYMGRSVGIPTAYPHVDKNVDDLAKPQACSSEPNGREYFTLFPNFDWHKNLDKEIHIRTTVRVPFEYTPITPTDNTCYTGYFQSEKYFPDKGFIRHLFEPANFIKEKMAKYDDVIGDNKASIHVRRGDYVKLGHVYRVLDMDYYNETIKVLKLRGVREYLIFSNDIEWCRENFRGEQFIFINEDKYTDLFLMSRCAHHVIANSAYSWWGAWLNPSPDKCVIVPGKWFVSNTLSSRDIVPQDWIRI